VEKGTRHASGPFDCPLSQGGGEKAKALPSGIWGHDLIGEMTLGDATREDIWWIDGKFFRGRAGFAPE
jgi:hypothetical protein